MKKLVLLENKFILNEAEVGQEDVGQSSYAQLYNTSVDKQGVINNFLNFFETQYNLKLNISLKQKISDQIKQLGGGDALNHLKNPYLQFLVNYAKVGLDVSQFNAVDYDNLIQLYGNHIISQANMFARGPQGQNDIIFVESLWQNSYKEIEYLCQASYWLNDKYNVSSLHIDKLDTNNLDKARDFISYLGGDVNNFTVPEILKDIPNYILFVDEIYSHKGQLRKANQIFKALDYLDSVATDLGVKNQNKTDLDTIKNIVVKDNNKWVNKKLDPKNLTKRDAEELIKYLIDSQKLNI